MKKYRISINANGNFQPEYRLNGIFNGFFKSWTFFYDRRNDWERVITDKIEDAIKWIEDDVKNDNNYRIIGYIPEETFL